MSTDRPKRLQFLRNYVANARESEEPHQWYKPETPLNSCTDEYASGMPLREFTTANSSPAPSMDFQIQAQPSEIINESCLGHTGESLILEDGLFYQEDLFQVDKIIPMGHPPESGPILDEDEPVDDSDKDKNYETESEHGDSSSDDDPTSSRKIKKKRKMGGSLENSDEEGRQGQPQVSPNNEGTKNENKSRNKKRGHKKETRAIRNERKVKRNLGKSYVTKKNKMVPERKCRDLETCRLKCNERLKTEIRKTLFLEYWSTGSYNRRVAYIADLISTKEKETTRTKKPDKKHKNRCVSHTYHLRINGQMTRVCKKCFLFTFDETNKFLTNVIKKKQSSISGITEEDGRGKGAPFNKTSEEALDLIRQHISALPTYESHYCRKQTENRFLPSYYTLSRIYEEYVKWLPETMTPVSRRIYETVFHSMKIKIKNPKKDSCAKCDKLNMQIKNTSDTELKEALKSELNKHQSDAEYAYESKRMDKLAALNDKSESVYTFDLQQCLPTPDIQTSVVFYKRQLWTYNLTVHRCEDKQVFCLMWDEGTAKRGANEIASCIFKHFENNMNPDTKRITLYSDTCAGQNKNSYLPIMYMLLLRKYKTLEYINHKFLVPGHTHMECDTDHSIIEKKKKKYESPIEHPRDWMQLVRMCGTTKPFKVTEMHRQDFFDFAALLKSYFINKKTNDAGEQVTWKDIKWLRYSSDEFGIVQYKNTLEQNAPFKKIDFRRKSKTAIPNNIKVPLSYRGPVPINEKKKKNLMELLPFIDKNFHLFYENLTTKDDIPDAVPSCDEDSDQ